MNLERNKILTALRCFSSPPNSCNCVDCYFETEGLCNQNCSTELADVIYAFIFELTEKCKDFEIRALRAEKQADIYQDRCKTIEANTIRKMQERLKTHAHTIISHNPYKYWFANGVLVEDIDHTAKELLEEMPSEEGLPF